MNFALFKGKLLSSSRGFKQFVVATTDLISFSVATLLACVSSNLSISEITNSTIVSFIFLPLFSVFIFYVFGVYRSVLRYIDFAVIYLLFKAIFSAFVLILLIKYLYIYTLDYYFQILFQSQIGLLGWVVGLLSTIVLVVSSRIYANYILSTNVSEKRVVIYGAGSAGIQLAEALKVSSEMQPIAFIDADPSLQGTFLGGIKILKPKQLRKLVSRNKVDEVLIAMPSTPKSLLRGLLDEIESYSIKVRILPGLAELAQGKVLVSELKEVDISDLLGRVEVEANLELLNKNIKGKVVLITGAGGSIGSEISKQVSNCDPKKVILLDSNEYSLYKVKRQIENLNPNVQLYSLLSSVTNKNRLKEVCTVFGVNTIYHCAAYKHVPLVEENPFEGVVNNIFGTQICAEVAVDSGVETFVLISTDKAVRPTNIMGATKRFSEMILQSLSKNTDLTSSTRMTMVRFGNVIGSSGSAIPLFQQQIKDGGPVTVTDPEVIRYFMSIPEAAELVIQAGAMGEGGDVFVLDMGEPVKIIEIAKRLIKLSGLEIKDKERPEGDIEIIITGLRPGEKLYEELLIGDNVSNTLHPQILRAEEDFLSREELKNYINSLKEAVDKQDVGLLKKILGQVVQGFTSEEEIVDVVYLQKQKID